jgi:uncharacterized membrane protein YgdD (TMEM256/DUF423 family)
MNRIFILLGGLAGAAGVALAARNAHSGELVISNATALLETASTFLMIHAAALLAIGLAPFAPVIAIGGAALAIGLVLFCGALTLHGLAGDPSFVWVTPIGGGLLVIGWLVVAAGAFFRRA